MLRLTPVILCSTVVLSAVVLARTRLEPLLDRRGRAEPLIIDMHGDGYQLTTAEDGVLFDLELTGAPEKIGGRSGGREGRDSCATSKTR